MVEMRALLTGEMKKVVVLGGEMRALLTRETEKVVIPVGETVNVRIDGDACHLAYVLGGTTERQRLSFVIDQAACP